MQNYELLLDIDSVLDTRLTTLQSITPLYRTDTYLEQYLTRTHDNFPFVGSGIFNRIYNRRDINILNNSMPTDISVVLNAILPIEQITGITLNMYPYPKSDYMGKLVSTMAGGIRVTVISKPPTINLWSTYNTVITYDAILTLDKWIHNGTLRRGSILTKTNILTTASMKDDLKVTQLDYNKTLKNMSNMYKGIATVNFIAPIIFSIQGDNEIKD